jgi:hypothetical protein
MRSVLPVLRNKNVRVDQIPNPRNVRIVRMTGMDAESGILVRMEDGRMPTLKSVVKSLRPTKTLIVVSVGTELGPLPIGIAAENHRSRVVTLVNASLGKSLTGKLAFVEDVQPFNPEWSVMLSHITIIAKRG